MDHSAEPGGIIRIPEFTKTTPKKLQASYTTVKVTVYVVTLGSHYKVSAAAAVGPRR